MLQTVQKAAEVLNLFSIERSEWGISELAKVLSFPKSSTSALVSTMAEQGLLRRTSTGRYKLGWQVMALSQVLLSTTDFRIEARPIMESLIARFGETVHGPDKLDSKSPLAKVFAPTSGTEPATSLMSSR